ncbi:MAG: hypothetical protein PWQ18_699 [Clostridia bacterium]|nr:hypothetical protein [Clostridia bacterium]
MWRNGTFIGLISNADDEGRLPGHPALLKATIFPYDTDVGPGEVATWLEKLTAKGLVVTYEAGGEAVIWIRNFRKHQTIKKPTPSKLPPPPEETAGSCPVWHTGTTRLEAARRVGTGRQYAGIEADAACWHVVVEGAAAVGEPARAFAYEAGPEAGDRPVITLDAVDDRPVLPGAAPIPPAPEATPAPAGRDPGSGAVPRRPSWPGVVAADSGECVPAAPALSASSQDTLPAAEHEGQFPAPSPPCPPGPSRPGRAGATSPVPESAAVTAGGRPGLSGAGPLPARPDNISAWPYGGLR